MSIEDPGSLSTAPDPWDHNPVRTRRPWWFWLATGVGGIVLFLSACFVALYYLYAPDLPITADRLGEVNRTPSITLMDAEGKIFATRGAAFGYRVKLDEMPAYLPAAFIVTEDRRFYSHSGVDYRGLLRAFFANWRAGGVVQGGSTITQQLAKNTFLKPERTWSRKFEELFLSFWLERHYSKDEILTLYLNRIYLGSGAYGIDAAAREHFGKSVRNVSLAEAAMLAALTRAPSKYSPDVNLKLAQQRANLVIDLLHQDGQISDEEGKARNPGSERRCRKRELLRRFRDGPADETRYPPRQGPDRPHDDQHEAPSGCRNEPGQNPGPRRQGPQRDTSGLGCDGTERRRPQHRRRQRLHDLDIQPRLSSPPPARLVV
jgi:membrane carboxypeptidase/penicillin-binding protein